MLKLTGHEGRSREWDAGLGPKSRVGILSIVLRGEFHQKLLGSRFSFGILRFKLLPCLSQTSTFAHKIVASSDNYDAS
jgi:hypothetical protein